MRLIGLAVGCRKEYAPGYIEAGYKSQEDESDYVWDISDETLITLSGSSATVDGEGAAVGRLLFINAGERYL